VLLANDGFLGPNVDDALRLTILVLSGVNVAVLIMAVRMLRLTARLLLDVEQFAREVRQQTRALREQTRTEA
jgi:hypothetical protein